MLADGLVVFDVPELVPLVGRPGPVLLPAKFVAFEGLVELDADKEERIDDKDELTMESAGVVVMVVGGVVIVPVPYERIDVVPLPSGMPDVPFE